MVDPMSGGATIAWHLFATLEGGSLFLAASALLAYATRSKLATHNKVTPKQVNKVIVVTNANSKLGKEVITRLEIRGCNVSSLKSATMVEPLPETLSETLPGAMPGAKPGGDNEVDALVVIGAPIKVDGLDGMAGLVSEDVYCNLKLLESLSGRVSSGGRIVWASASIEYNEGGQAATDRDRGVYALAVQAYDALLHATLQHVSKAYVNKRPPH